MNIFFDRLDASLPYPVIIRLVRTINTMLFLIHIFTCLYFLYSDIEVLQFHFLLDLDLDPEYYPKELESGSPKALIRIWNQNLKKVKNPTPEPDPGPES